MLEYAMRLKLHTARLAGPWCCGWMAAMPRPDKVAFLRYVLGMPAGMPDEHDFPGADAIKWIEVVNASLPGGLSGYIHARFRAGFITNGHEVYLSAPGTSVSMRYDIQNADGAWLDLKAVHRVADAGFVPDKEAPRMLAAAEAQVDKAVERIVNAADWLIDHYEKPKR